MNDKLRAAVEALAVRLDTAAVHRDEGTHEGQTDPEAAFGVLERAVCLCEEIEDAREHFRGDPDPVVAYAEHNFVVDALGAKHNQATRVRVLDRVREKIHERLRETRLIGH